MLALLVVVSLILLTAYFGESPNSPLYSVQRGVVEVLSPVQEGASKVLGPVRNIAGWFSDTIHAKSQRDKLQTEVQRLRTALAQAQQKALDYNQLAAEVKLDQSHDIAAYNPLTANVIGRDPTLWWQTITVDRGGDDGVKVDDPVLGGGALAGKVTTVTPNASIITLLTDHTFAVAAEVQDQNADTGVLQPAVGNPNQLLLGSLPQLNPGQPAPQVGQQVVTGGFKPGPLASLYPPGIPIGVVSNADQNQLYNNQQVQVSPYAPLRRLTFVQILTNPTPGTQQASAGTGRPTGSG